jgi:hypothetical protein
MPKPFELSPDDTSPWTGFWELVFRAAADLEARRESAEDRQAALE